jgi:hypothetical protein
MRQDQQQLELLERARLLLDLGTEAHGEILRAR